MGHRFEYRLEPNPRELGPMRRALAAWLGDRGARDIAGVVLAVDEAAANSIEHAGVSPQRSIAIRCSIAGRVLCVEVCDPGSWKHESPDSSRGRGLAIMRKLMDEVHVHLDGAETRVVMTRSLD